MIKLVKCNCEFCGAINTVLDEEYQYECRRCGKTNDTDFTIDLKEEE
jgi:tRNA(Ile2) C34 agmatinyltransferase TiaS